MCEDMIVQHMHITQRGFSRRKAQLRQLSRCIVNEDQQRATVAAPFKPVVRAAIYLDQLAKPRTPLTHRVSAYRAALLGLPIARFDHNLPRTLDGELNAMQLSQLLASQSRPKVTVVRADEVNRRRAGGFIQMPV